MYQAEKYPNIEKEKQVKEKQVIILEKELGRDKKVDAVVVIVVGILVEVGMELQLLYPY
jgi:hypothetical protein